MSESRIRDERGRFIPGYTLTPEEIKRRAESINRNIRNRLEDDNYPDKKKCTKCKEWKNSREDFYIVRRKYKKPNGTLRVVLEPTPSCKECEKARFAARREERRKQGLLSEDYKRWKRNQDPEKLRAKQREYQAVLRRKRGQKAVGPWIKYRETPRSDNLPMRPLADFVKHAHDNYGMSYNQIAIRAGMDSRRLRNLENPTDQNRITSDFAERVIKAIDPDIHLSEVYPDLYN